MTTEPSLNVEDLRRVAEVVRARYTPVPVPPCVVCGKPLNVARAGGGIVAYACDAAPMADGDHYARSSFETRAGDPDVLSLLNYISSVEAERDEAREHARWLIRSATAEGLSNSERLSIIANSPARKEWASALQASEARAVALEAERDAAVAAWERVTEDPVGSAERDVGRWVYERISKLMDAKENTPEAAELSWLAEVVENIEEYGSIHCAGEALAAFPSPQALSEPNAQAQMSTDPGVGDGGA